MTDELRDVARYIDSLSAPVALEEITDRSHRTRSTGQRAAVFAVAVTLVAAMSAVVVVALSDRASEPARTNPTGIPPAPSPTSTTTTMSTSTANAVITSIPLPGGLWFNDVAASDRGLLLTGVVASDSGSSQTCVATTIDPQTLQFAHSNEGSCDDPGLSGETVAPTYAPSRSNDRTCCNGTVAIARTDAQTGLVTTGPVVMTYGDYSDTRPITAYGGDWLWIYDVATTNGAEVLQISRSSGEVVNTVKTQTLYRPILAADDDGLWLGNSVRGGQCKGCGPPPALSFLAAGAHAAVPVPAAGSQYTFWLRATGHHVWAGVGPVYNRQTFVRFDGTDLQPVFQTPERGFDPSAVVGDEADGLWAIVPNTSNTASGDTFREDVVRIDPASGKETVFVTLPPFVMPAATFVDTLPAAVSAGSLFVLEPPYRANGFLGYSTLVRVTPRD